MLGYFSLPMRIQKKTTSLDNKKFIECFKANDN